MPRVEDEVVVMAQASGHGVEQSGRHVPHDTAPAALHVEVRLASEVVGGGTVTEMDMLHDAGVGQRVQGTVDARPMNTGGLPCHPGDHLFGRAVTVGARETRKYRPPRAGHPLTPGVQDGRHVRDEQVERLLAHRATVVPHRRHRSQARPWASRPSVVVANEYDWLGGRDVEHTGWIPKRPSPGRDA